MECVTACMIKSFALLGGPWTPAWDHHSPGTCRLWTSMQRQIQMCTNTEEIKNLNISITKCPLLMLHNVNKVLLKINISTMDGPANMLKTLDGLFHNFEDNEVEIEHTRTCFRTSVKSSPAEVHYGTGTMKSLGNCSRLPQRPSSAPPHPPSTELLLLFSFLSKSRRSSS